MTVSVKLLRDTYVDSIVQLGGMLAMRQIGGVDWASAAMATPANIETLRAEGVDPAEVTGAGSNDFFLVVKADSAEIAAEALEAGQSAVLSERTRTNAAVRETTPRSVRDALRSQPEATVAVVSVPGDYAALAAFQA